MANDRRILGADRDVPFASNAVRLSLGQWGVVAAIVTAVFLLTPRIWQQVETFETGADYRVPYGLSNDYWLFDRWCRVACSRGNTLVIGDSVIWGQYVRTNETLSHHLSARAGNGRFANVGLDGAHPVALAGLLEHFGRAICGPLTSAERAYRPGPWHIHTVIPSSRSPGRIHSLKGRRTRSSSSGPNAAWADRASRGYHWPRPCSGDHFGVR